MNKSVNTWISTCPKCGCNEIEIEGQSCSEMFVTQDSSAKCTKCGHGGFVEVYGAEECDVAWDEE